MAKLARTPNNNLNAAIYYANNTPIDNNIPPSSPPPLLNRNRKRLLLAIAVILVVVIVVVAVFGPKINTNSNKADLSTFMMFINDGGSYGVHVSGEVVNNGNQMAYNCRLHIKDVYPNGAIALDTYIQIGNQGTIPPHTYVYVDSGTLHYQVQTNSRTPNWSVTPIGTNNP